MTTMLTTLILAAVTVASTPADPRDARELLGMMRQRTSYNTLTFVQTTKFPGRPDQTWYESLAPGKLRIDVAPLDIYHIAPESSAARLTRMGFDLSKMHEDTFLGRRVWAVGAERGDTVTPQFWIDAERLHMVRIIERGQGAQGGVNDGQVISLRRHGNVWLEHELVFYTNGREMQREIYNDVVINPPLDMAIFEPDQYRRPSWIPAGTP
jgi:hypothetical protein